MTLPAVCPACRLPTTGTILPHICGSSADAASRATQERAPIWITTENYAALNRLVRSVSGPIAAYLADELCRAVICAPDWIAEDVVTMNSRVVFACDDEAAAQERVLVYPDRYEPNGQCLSVLSPLGAALVGLAEGSALPFRDRNGEVRRVRVERVAFQPEASRRRAGTASQASQ